MSNSPSGQTVKVIVRTRPTGLDRPVSIKVDEGCGSVMVSRDKKSSAEFKFTQVFGPLKTQKEIFPTCNLIQDVFEGINCCVMAYGQTGSGKTFTMYGKGWEDSAMTKNSSTKALQKIPSSPLKGTNSIDDDQTVDDDDDGNSIDTFDSNYLSQQNQQQKHLPEEEEVEEQNELETEGGELNQNDQRDSETEISDAATSEATPSKKAKTKPTKKLKKKVKIKKKSLKRPSSSSSSQPHPESSGEGSREGISGRPPPIPSEPDEDREDMLGIIPRSINELFAKIEEKSQHSHFEYSINMQIMQIYNEKIYDLLHDKKRKNPLQLRESRSSNDQGSLASNASTSGSVYVRGITLYRIDSKEEAFALLKKALRNRAIRSTDFNQESSRSHTILQLFVTIEEEDSMGLMVMKRSTLSLVDLAGSEKWRSSLSLSGNFEGLGSASAIAGSNGSNSKGNASNNSSAVMNPSSAATNSSPVGGVETVSSNKSNNGGLAATDNANGSNNTTSVSQSNNTFSLAQQLEMQVKEMNNINTSLHVLGNCVSALIDPHRKHIPYRDSILTRLLQDAISGHGRTVLIATIHGADDYREETYSTLQFASRASCIKVSISANLGVNEKINLEDAQKQIRMLRAKLLEFQSGTQSSGSSTPIKSIATSAGCSQCQNHLELIGKLKDKVKELFKENQTLKSQVESLLSKKTTTSPSARAHRPVRRRAGTSKEGSWESPSNQSVESIASYLNKYGSEHELGGEEHVEVQYRMHQNDQDSVDNASLRNSNSSFKLGMKEMASSPATRILESNFDSLRFDTTALKSQDDHHSLQNSLRGSKEEFKQALDAANSFLSKGEFVPHNLSASAHSSPQASNSKLALSPQSKSPQKRINPSHRPEFGEKNTVTNTESVNDGTAPQMNDNTTTYNPSFFPNLKPTLESDKKTRYSRSQVYTHNKNEEDSSMYDSLDDSLTQKSYFDYQPSSGQHPPKHLSSSIEAEDTHRLSRVNEESSTPPAFQYSSPYIDRNAKISNGELQKYSPYYAGRNRPVGSEDEAQEHLHLSRSKKDGAISNTEESSDDNEGEEEEGADGSNICKKHGLEQCVLCTMFNKKKKKKENFTNNDNSSIPKKTQRSSPARQEGDMYYTGSYAMTGQQSSSDFEVHQGHEDRESMTCPAHGVQGCLLCSMNHVPPGATTFQGSKQYPLPVDNQPSPLNQLGPGRNEKDFVSSIDSMDSNFGFHRKSKAKRRSHAEKKSHPSEALSPILSDPSVHSNYSQPSLSVLQQSGSNVIGPPPSSINASMSHNKIKNIKSIPSMREMLPDYGVSDSEDANHQSHSMGSHRGGITYEDPDDQVSLSSVNQQSKDRSKDLYNRKRFDAMKPSRDMEQDPKLYPRSSSSPLPVSTHKVLLSNDPAMYKKGQPPIPQGPSPYHLPSAAADDMDINPLKGHRYNYVEDQQTGDSGVNPAGQHQPQLLQDHQSESKRYHTIRAALDAAESMRPKSKKKKVKKVKKKSSAK